MGDAAGGVVPGTELVLIDFRYHIVSLVAVFLALGLGLLIGAAVLDQVTVDQLEGRLDSLSGDLDGVRRENTELRADRDRASAVVDALAPRITEGALTDERVLFVRGTEESSWHNTVRGHLVDAGAINVGTVILSDRWELDDPDDRTALREALTGTGLEGTDPTEALRLVGGVLSDAAGGDVVDRLVEREFIRLELEDEEEVPGQDASFVVLDGPGPVELSEFARGAASRRPTLVVAPSTDALGAVSAIREGDDPPSALTTFDSAAEDGTGIGVVLALRASLDRRGGHFGNGRGLSYVPAP